MKTADHFYRHTAEQLGLDPVLVKKANQFFWRELKRGMARSEHPAFFVKHFGTFVVMRRNLYAEIYATIRSLRRVRASRYYTDKKRGLILESLTLHLRGLLTLRNQLAKQTAHE